ncbi:hypothetical protein [Neptunicella sp. SCSIO 80796]|uniref:hypothetical protein n=1 Tax=Neptunicella plasticusilytica TaxID=3117012 RepID=UPI003A4D5CE3
MKKTSVVLLLSALITIPVMAKESVTIKDKFDVVEDSQIEIHVPVGEFELTTHDGHYIELSVKVEEQDNSWFSSADLDDVELTKQVSHSRIFLEIDEEDTKQTWQISVPADANINLDMGVGEAKLKQLSRDVKAELGVGELSIEVSSDNYKSINLESGVGEASLRGFKQSESSRALISEEAYWQGSGKYMIDAQVGVGEVSVSR